MGKSKKIKRLRSESPVASEELCHNILPTFPNEVWMIILRNLKDSPKSLFTCRFVSKHLKSLADAVLKESAFLWKPIQTWEMFTELAKEAKGAKGIRFSTAKQVKTFLSKTKVCTWNPFPNGTVIFCPSRYLRTKGYDEFYEAFLLLVSVYHEEISTLVYCFKKSTNLGQLNAQLVNIFQLKKLQCLVIFSEDGDVKNGVWSGGEKNPFAPAQLSRVTELQIFGLGEKVLPYLVRTLCAAVNRSCKRLLINPCDTGCMCGSRERYGRFLELNAEEANSFDFLKLEELKMLAPDMPNCWQHLQFGSNKNSQGLRKVSIRFEIASTEGIEQLMMVLEGSAASLQMLHVQMFSNAFRVLGNSNPEMSFNETKEPQFKKMKYLVLDYYTISQWRNLVPYWKKRFPNLKELTIIINDWDQETRETWEFRAIVMDLWRDLPSSLEVIHVPYFSWSLDRAGSG